MDKTHQKLESGTVTFCYPVPRTLQTLTIKGLHKNLNTLQLAPPPVHLVENEREQLQQLVNRHSTPQQIALRASIILLADEGLNHRQIARELGISRDMARLWRNRWLELEQKQSSVVERLADAPRPGRPATFIIPPILE